MREADQKRPGAGQPHPRLRAAGWRRCTATPRRSARGRCRAAPAAAGARRARRRDRGDRAARGRGAPGPRAADSSGPVRRSRGTSRRTFVSCSPWPNRTPSACIAGPIPVGEAGPVRHVHLGPELAHAARHQVGVPVEVGARLERGELALVLAGKDAQVLRHALDDGGEEPSHARLIGRGERPIGREDRRAGARAAGARRAATASPPRRRRWRRCGPPAPGCSSSPSAAEVDDPRAPLDEARVGDGVRRPGEEIGEPDGGAHRGGQHRQGQIEGAADLLEERGGEVAPRHEDLVHDPLDSGAGRASPWPS